MLYHSRLPIVGLSSIDDQPVYHEQWVVAFVGEILNYREFTDESCDAPLVARTLSEKGPEGFRKFDGFWAVAAHNSIDKSIHLLCDYLAQKPIYYRSDNYAIAAASEPDAVAALAPVSPDETYFASVIKWGYCPEPWRTPYREITMVQPGEYVILRPDPGKIECRLVDGLQPAASSVYSLKHEIEEAVKRRVLSSDVPVSCLLSGGLDSSIVYTLAKRYGEVVPFYVENKEEEWAQLVAGGDLVTLDSNELYAQEFEGTNGHSEGALDRALRYMQEPLDLGSLVPQTALSDVVGARRFNVALTGDGSDEFFGGYGRAQRYDSQSSDVFHELVCYHLPRLDRVMMRNRIEVRSPFLSRRVCELALGLPRPLRTNKKILRDLFRSDLPDGVADREKVPLRTADVESDREGRSRLIVEMFRRSKWS
jgi:asparagine synthase (glutamine-hydrolysing)